MGLWVSFGVILAVVITLGHSCTREVATKDLDLSTIIGRYVEEELTEDPDATDCQEITVVYEPKDNTLLMHGHFYDAGTERWVVYTVTFEQDADDKTAVIPRVMMDKPGTTPWQAIKSAKLVKFDGKHMVWALCMHDGSDMILIFRLLNVPYDENALNDLINEFKLPAMSKFHGGRNEEICPNFM